MPWAENGFSKSSSVGYRLFLQRNQQLQTYHTKQLSVYSSELKVLLVSICTIGFGAHKQEIRIDFRRYGNSAIKKLSPQSMSCLECLDISRAVVFKQTAFQTHLAPGQGWGRLK